MNDQHVAFVLWVCLYPVSIALIRLINHFIRKPTPIVTPVTPQDLEKIKQETKSKMSAGCFMLLTYWGIAYLLW